MSSFWIPHLRILLSSALSNELPGPAPSATAYKQRFQADFRGPIIPFGAAVSYKPSGERDLDDMPKLGTKLRDGIFVGYDQICGGGWSGDLYVLDAAQLASADAVS